MIWSVSDISNGKEYCLDLCQSNSGKRTFSLVEPSEEHTGLYRTEIIDKALLLKRSLIMISKNSLLENGDKFYVDPHGMWITQKESDQLENGVDFFDVEWDTAEPPEVARR